MKYFAAFLPMLDSEKSQTLRPDHLEYLAARRREGQIFAQGRFVDGSGGLVIYMAESFEEARRLAAADPYVIHGARRLEFHEWAMTLAERAGQA